MTQLRWLEYDGCADELHEVIHVPVVCCMINSQSIAAISDSSHFLAGLEPFAKHAILDAAELRSLPAKHAISTEGNAADHFFLVQRGQARYCRITKQGEMILLARLVPGDVIGLMTLVRAPSSYMANAETISDCELLIWDRILIRDLVSRYPQLGENSLRISLDYLQNYIDRHLALLTDTAEERLATTLLRLGRQSGKIHPDGVEIRATNEEISALADISPFTASRALSEWARTGTITKTRGHILLHAPEALMID